MPKTPWRYNDGMKFPVPHLESLTRLTVDGRILFATRMIRLFAYGLISVVLVLYLKALGFDDWHVGSLLTLTLVGDTLISLWLTTSADRVGRRRMLSAGAVLMLAAGVLFAFTNNYWLLLLAATVGVISPSGGEVGPFLAIEQASLSQSVESPHRTDVFAWYNLVGSLAMAFGSLAGGSTASMLHDAGFEGDAVYRPLLIAYACLGLVLGLLFTLLSNETETKPTNVPSQPSLFLGLHRSRNVVMRLAGLFGMDAFAGGFVMQSLLAYWFHERFGADEATLGAIFLGANLLAGFSSLAAGWLANRFGLINTMVFTHLPSNLFLILVPLMPNFPLAVTMLLLRFSISQMDVPTRQAYTVAVVAPDERSAAAGVTGVARSVGASLSPVLATGLLGNAAWASVPFFLSGGIKILYDLLLYRAFVAAPLPDDTKQA